MRLGRLVLVLGPLACGVSSIAAQAVTRVEVRITAVSGNAIFIDQGRAAGIQAGDTLVLDPPGRSRVRALVSYVSRTSARAELPPGAGPLRVGLRATVLVPQDRDETTEEEVEGKVEHPPWKHPPLSGNPDRPLLAPAFGRGPAARPVRVQGRTFAQYFSIFNRGRQAARFALGRVGTELTVHNPARLGGRLHFRGEIDRRVNVLADEPDERSTRLRLDRISYAWGDTPKAPVRIEVGRFLPSQVPELGLIDGVEARFPLAPASHLAVSVGGFPEPFPTRDTGKDFESAVSYRFTSGEDEDLAVDLAYQKTWHEGSPDRDLLFGDLALRPSQDLSIYSALWIDYYGGGDRIKPQGFEVTEFHLQGSYTLNVRHGLGLHFSHIRYPELKRDEFRALSPSQIKDSRLLRLGIDSWHEILDGVRLEPRIDHWNDQDGAGTSFEMRVALRDLLYARGEVAVTVFHDDAAFTSGTGFRISANRSVGAHLLSLSWEWSHFDDGQLSGGGGLDEQALVANGDFTLTSSMNLTVSADYRFGDLQEAFTLDLFTQVRF